MGATPKKTCGVETADGTSCKRLINRDEEACFIHDEGGTPEGIGAPEGNDNAEGNDGGAPHGNTNAARHGAYMPLDRRLEYIDGRGFGDEYAELYEYYQEKVDDDLLARRLASFRTVHVMVEEEIFTEGFSKEVPYKYDGEIVRQPETGEPYTTKRLHPAFSAWIRASRQTRLLLRETGLTQQNEDDEDPP